MTSKISVFLIAALCSLFLTSCSTTKVQVLYGDATQLAKLKTWRWHHAQSLNQQAEPSGDFETLVKQFVEQQMNKSGYQKVATDQASDFFLDFRVSVTQTAVPSDGASDPTRQNFDQDNIHDYGMQWNFDGQGGVSRGHWKNPENEYRFYRQGTLFIGAFSDPQTKQEEPKQLWVGSVQRPLKTERVASEAERNKVLEEAVISLTRKIPPSKQP